MQKRGQRPPGLRHLALLIKNNVAVDIVANDDDVNVTMIFKDTIAKVNTLRLRAPPALALATAAVATIATSDTSHRCTIQVFADGEVIDN
jgi:hypothetical protein